MLFNQISSTNLKKIFNMINDNICVSSCYLKLLKVLIKFLNNDTRECFIENFSNIIFCKNIKFIRELVILIPEIYERVNIFDIYVAISGMHNIEYIEKIIELFPGELSDNEIMKLLSKSRYNKKFIKKIISLYGIERIDFDSTLIGVCKNSKIPTLQYLIDNFSPDLYFNNNKLFKYACENSDTMFTKYLFDNYANGDIISNINEYRNIKTELYPNHETMKRYFDEQFPR